MKTGFYVLYLPEFKGYYVNVYHARSEEGSFVGTVVRDQVKTKKIKPKIYKSIKTAEKGIAAIVRNHWSTTKEDIEIVELTMADIDAMGLYSLVV
ncbi:hypothetical protein [Enterococcus sp. BWR-S5]|uniref:hypothetical protein n=1 Tax=Enterococcus sp. BWR-S5 TaxID=2787714 RepID=UPI001922A4DB|nr:hypothetical protein [Enterococcus sp. BWR-S5]MBL1227136.1 hypothetical protein [Enterococcus sp. BWR-S5]